MPIFTLQEPAPTELLKFVTMQVRKRLWKAMWLPESWIEMLRHLLFLSQTILRECQGNRSRRIGQRRRRIGNLNGTVLCPK